MLDKKVNKLLHASLLTSSLLLLPFTICSAFSTIQMTVACSYLTTILSTVSGTSWPHLHRVGEMSDFKATEKLSNQEASLGERPL